MHGAEGRQTETKGTTTMRSTANTRVDRLMPALTFEERLDGLLAAYHADRPADPLLLGTLPARDGERWNETADILDGLHVRLGWYIDLVESFITQVELRLALANVGRYLSGFLKHHALEMGAAVERLEETVIGELVQRWREIRLAELAAEHFGEELGGRSLLHPKAVAQLDDCRARLLAMRASLGDASQRTVVYEVELPEPDPLHLDQLVELLTLQAPVL